MRGLQTSVVVTIMRGLQTSFGSDGWIGLLSVLTASDVVMMSTEQYTVN
jgi:hypothetical protein